MTPLTRTALIWRRLGHVVRKRRYLTAEQRSRRALRQVIGGALLTGYAFGWWWRARSSEASSRRSGG